MNIKLVHRLRFYRKFHRYVGIVLLVFVVISSITGILLSWKKNSTTLQPFTQFGISRDVTAWLPMERIIEVAQHALDSVTREHYEVERLDVRPKKGVVKVLFEKGYWEVQVDVTTGKVLSVSQRHADWIEKIHDGSIINDTFKLISMNLLGIGLLILCLSGFWMWYGPRLIRRLKDITNQ